MGGSTGKTVRTLAAPVTAPFEIGIGAVTGDREALGRGIGGTLGMGAIGSALGAAGGREVERLTAKDEPAPFGESPEDQERRFAARRAAIGEDIRAGREADLARGRERGQELFGREQFFVRDRGDIQADTEDIIARRRASLEGFSPEERNLLREQATAPLMQQQATALRQLRGAQAQSGVRGGLAGAQQAGLISQQAGQRAGLERDVALANIQRRQEALGDFESTIGGEQGRAQKQQFAQLGTELGFGQLGASERAAGFQQALGEQQLAQSRNQAAAAEGKK